MNSKKCFAGMAQQLRGKKTQERWQNGFFLFVLVHMEREEWKVLWRLNFSLLDFVDPLRVLLNRLVHAFVLLA